MTTIDCCCEITPSASLPRAAEEHASLAALGRDGWLYLAQFRHEPLGEDQLRLDACELANQRWHRLLDTTLDPRPLSGTSADAHCHLAFEDQNTEPRLALAVRSPRGSWRWEQTSDNKALAPLALCDGPASPALAARLECSAQLSYPGGAIGVVRAPVERWRIIALVDLDGEAHATVADPHDWLDSLDPDLKGRATQAAIQDRMLHVAVGDDDSGFSLWRLSLETDQCQWSCLLERGAERYVHNREVLALAPHNRHLYIAAGTSPDRRHPESAFFDYQGFELLRINASGDWDLIAGVPRVSPQGLKLPLSMLGPGLGARQRREWHLLHAQAGHLILGASDEEGLRLWHSREGEQWTALAQQGLEQIQTIERCRAIVCAPREAVLLLDTLGLDGRPQTRIWRLDLSALDSPAQSP